VSDSNHYCACYFLDEAQKPDAQALSPSNVQLIQVNMGDSSESKKIIVVIGASGIQGGSVVRAILDDPDLSTKFSIRAISRDPTKSQEKCHFPASVEWIKADLNDPSSLAAAFDGAHTVFGTTNIWEVFSADVEIQQGRNIADTAKGAGVTHLIWSAQYSAKKISGGQDIVASHLDAKYHVSEYIEEAKKGSEMKASYICVPFYMSNFAKLFTFVGQDGVREWKYPWHATETKIGFTDSKRDVGIWVVAIMKAFAKDPVGMDGKYTHAVGEFLSPAQIGEGYKKVRGEELRYEEVSVEVFKQILPASLAGELPHHMQIAREFGLYGPDERERQPEHDKILEGGKKKGTWEEYLRRDWDEDVQNSLLPQFT
jgi:putative NADH-flavin reductase